MHTDKNQNLCAAYIRKIRAIRVRKLTIAPAYIRIIREIRVRKIITALA